MSTDLKLMLPVIRSNPSQISDDGSGAIQITDRDPEEVCRTPKSPRHRIPPLLRCPSPPKKPRPAARLERKFCELRFFFGVSREEIERFFEVVERNFNGSTERMHCSICEKHAHVPSYF